VDDTTLYVKVCQRSPTGHGGVWGFLAAMVSSINKTDHNKITEIPLKVMINRIFSNNV
jgi:hypothetical protein